MAPKIQIFTFHDKAKSNSVSMLSSKDLKNVDVLLWIFGKKLWALLLHTPEKNQATLKIFYANYTGFSVIRTVLFEQENKNSNSHSFLPDLHNNLDKLLNQRSLYHFRSIISDSVGHEADESSENEDDDDVLEAKTPVAQNYYGYSNSPEKSYTNSIQSTPSSIRKAPVPPFNSLSREGNEI